MRKIERADVRDIIEYEKARDGFRRRIIELKKRRRVGVGRDLTFVFENRDTMIFQIQEMMRAERIVHEEGIADEIEVYNTLIPDENELSATLLIEITDQRRIKPVLDRLMGLDEPERVSLQFGGERVYAVFEEGRSNEEKISAVHFVRFPFSGPQARRFRSGEDTAYLCVDHPNYRRRAKIDPETRASLEADFA